MEKVEHDTQFLMEGGEVSDHHILFSLHFSNTMVLIFEKQQPTPPKKTQNPP